MREARVRRLACILAVLAVSAGAAARPTGQAASDPFAFLAPDVVLSESDRRKLARDEVIAETLDAGRAQLAVFAATPLKASPDALVIWTRAIAELKRSRFVLAIGRFSNPPRLSDVADLALDDRDLEAIRRCVPDRCSLKLAEAEITSLRRAVAGAGDAWRDAAQMEFRRLMVARVEKYRQGGLAALPPVGDDPVSPRETFDEILAQSTFVHRLPKISTWLRAYPAGADPAVESFFYWSNESYGRGKPVISITHVGIARSDAAASGPAVVVAGKQIFATHYIDASLGLTMVLRDRASGVPYLVYVNRSRVDMLEGFWGAFIRGVLERRLERDAPAIVRGLRARLESGQSPRPPSIP